MQAPPRTHLSMRVCLLALSVLNAGCTSWRYGKLEATAHPEQSEAENVSYATLRVWLADGSRVTLEHAYVRGDTLHGDVTQHAYSDTPLPIDQPVALPIDQLNPVIEHRGVDTRSAWIVPVALVGFAGIVLVIYAFAAIIGSCGGFGCQ